MKSQWTIRKKLIVSFLTVAAITEVLGVVGYYSVNQGAITINEIAGVRLPSMKSILTIRQGQTAIDAAEKALLCRNIDLPARGEKYAELVTIHESIENAWETYESLPRTNEEATNWREFVPAWNEWKKDHEEYIRLCKEYDNYAEDGVKAEQCYHRMVEQALAANVESFGKAEELLDRIVKTNSAVGAQVSQRSSTEATFLKILAVSSLVVGVILALGLGVLISRTINRTLTRIVDALTEGSEQLAAASGEISASSQSLAEGATEQAAGLQEASSSLEEMASMTRQNADNAQEANTLAGAASRAAGNGTESMARMNEAIEEIHKNSDETAKIIKVIDEIAFQTNLLALNAAVEAARAGEAGKGFAVVAEEVRNLAMRSADAAKNTANMIEESVKSAKNGVDIAGEVSEVLDEIVQSVSKTTELVSEIAVASQEQAQGIDQVNTAVAQIDKVTQQNAANAEESASASEELSAQAGSMNEIVNALVVLVGGRAAKRKEAGNKSSTQLGHEAAKKTYKLSDEHHELYDSRRLFHDIAGGGADTEQIKNTTVKIAAEKAIPMDEEQNSDGPGAFNGQ